MAAERPSVKKSVQRYRWICLLLALSFLYNPFSTVAATAGGLSVRHCASYRATVAMTELQQLAPMGDKQVQLFPAFFVVVSAVHVSREFHAQPAARLIVEARFPQNRFMSNLWFRPPPAQ